MVSLSALKRKLSKSLERRGLVGTARVTVSHALGQFGPLIPARRRALQRKRAAELEFDRELGVDTAGMIPLSELDIPGESWKYGVRYEPIGRVDLHEILKGLCLDYRRFAFIDLGAGKGRALLLASVLPFKKVIGVELSPQLSRVAVQNMRDYRGADRRCAGLDVICQDAALYQFPDEPTVLFLYNPFAREIMAPVVQNLRQSLARYPRPIVVIYFNPTCADVWDNAAPLSRVRTAPQYHLYATGLPGEAPQGVL